MILIIYCHPSKTSHNYKILELVKSTLTSEKKSFEVLDLYERNFDAYVSEAEYRRMRDNKREHDSDVLEMQKKITAADTLIFIYPVWWYTMPARLKGFIDRVFTSRFAYRFFKVHRILLFGANLLSYIPGIRYLMQPYVVTPLLKGKKAIIFRTYGGPSSGKRIFGNTVTVLENVVLRFCGMTDITIHELFNIDKEVFRESDEEKYFNTVGRICKNC